MKRIVKGAILMAVMSVTVMPAWGIDERLRGRFIDREFVYVWEVPYQHPWLDGAEGTIDSETRDDWFSSDMAFVLYPESDSDRVNIQSLIAYVNVGPGSQVSYSCGGWYTGVLEIPAAIEGADTHNVYSPGMVSISEDGVRRLKVAAENTSMRVSVSFCNLIREIELPERLDGGLSLTYCPRLEKINLPENLNSISSYDFVNTALREIELPSSLKEVGHGAFSGNYKLTGLDLGNLESAGDEAFSDNPRIKSIILPETLMRLGKECFSYMWGLEEVTLPAHEVEMEAGCFTYCPNLERVKVNAATPYKCPEFVALNSGGLTVYVPTGSLEAYRNAKGWKDVKELREGELPGSGVQSVGDSRWRVSSGPGCLYVKGLEGGRLTVTNLQGIRVAVLEGESRHTVPVEAGLYIVSDGERSCKVAVKSGR